MSRDLATMSRIFATLAFVIACHLPTGAEWTASFYGGEAWTQDSDIQIRQPSVGTDLSFRRVHWDDQSFEGPIYYGVRLGYFFNSFPLLGLEGEFIHLKAIAETERTVSVSGTLHGIPVRAEVPMEEIVQHFEVSHGVNFALLNVVGRLGLIGRSEANPVGTVRLVARVGVGPTIPHPESVIKGEGLSHYQSNGVGFGVGIGCEASFSRHVFGFVEYKRTYVDAEVDVPHGTAFTSFESNHVIFGLGVSF
jgi:opacity protein-like surface antigen